MPSQAITATKTGIYIIKNTQSNQSMNFSDLHIIESLLLHLEGCNTSNLVLYSYVVVITIIIGS